MAEEKPSVLIIGGLGYIGRFLALHIHKNNLASQVRLVDKVLPQLAWLAPEFAEACSQDKFVQADASRPESLPRIFDRSEEKPWDYVINCGGETRFSQEDEIYRLRSLNLSLNVGKEAAKRNVKCFVELSTGMVYKPDSTPSKEGDKLKPWSKIAVFKLQAEEELAKIEGLNLAIVRLANVYGPYATQPPTGTVLCLSRVYQKLEHEMKMLFSKDLCNNTVHIDDTARAIWEVCTWFAAGKSKWDATSMGATPTFNVVDKGATNQGRMMDIMAQMFKIETGFANALVNTFAKLNIESVVDDVNDEVLGPWADLLADAGITRPGPLTPFMEKDLLKDTDLSMDGSRLETMLGFTYEKPTVTKELMDEVVESYRRMNWWP